MKWIVKRYLVDYDVNLNKILHVQLVISTFLQLECKDLIDDLDGIQLKDLEYYNDDKMYAFLVVENDVYRIESNNND